MGEYTSNTHRYKQTQRRREVSIIRAGSSRGRRPSVQTHIGFTKNSVTLMNSTNNETHIRCKYCQRLYEDYRKIHTSESAGQDQGPGTDWNAAREDLDKPSRSEVSLTCILSDDQQEATPLWLYRSLLENEATCHLIFYLSKHFPDESTNSITGFKCSPRQHDVYLIDEGPS